MTTTTPAPDGRLVVVIASGKGGTGKTTIATNLAVLAAMDGESVHLLDCDVEEPNCHLFLQPQITRREAARVPFPVVDPARCTGCGECVEACEFNALACIGTDVLVFAELCHGCGACWLVCPQKAIRREMREMGVVEVGMVSELLFSQGRLKVGEAQVPPLIRQVKAAADGASLTIIDAPPGTACAAVTAMRGGDYIVLVTEPTPFGLHDLQLAVDTVRHLGRPFGVVVNRSDIGDDRVHRYCREQSIPVLLQIPHDYRIARAYSTGVLAVTAIPETFTLFRRLYRFLLQFREENNR